MNKGPLILRPYTELDNRRKVTMKATSLYDSVLKDTLITWA